MAKVQPAASFAKLTQKNDFYFEQLLTIYCDVNWFRITNFELCYQILKMKTSLHLVIVLILILSISGCNNKSQNAPGTSSTPENSLVSDEKGKTLYQACRACHGETGQGMEALHAPALSHQEDWYLKRQLQNFKNGLRAYHENDMYGKQMAPFIKNLSEDDIEQLVSFISKFPHEKPTSNIKGDINNGKTIYTKLCVACHGPQGDGMVAIQSPKLKGSQDWYLKQQLQNYVNGIRGAHPDDAFGSQMIPIVKQLNGEKDIEDVVTYIMSL